MKRLLLILAFTVTMAGCRSRTEYGECLGVQETRLENKAFVYRASVRNIVLGVVFIETLFAPLIVLLADWECPEERR